MERAKPNSNCAPLTLSTLLSRRLDHPMGARSAEL